MYGGAERVLVNLVNNLDKNKYDITLMTIFDTGINKDFLNKNVKYKYISIHDPYHWIGNFEENYKKIELWSKRYFPLNYYIRRL